MAGDWMKVEKATPDKSEIREIAEKCRVSEGDAFLGWFRVWCWLDGATATGHLPRLSQKDCDFFGRLPGLGQALAECGWIEFYADGSAIVRNWDRHNGDSAKKRALANWRKARFRGRGATVVGNA